MNEYLFNPNLLMFVSVCTAIITWYFLKRWNFKNISIKALCLQLAIAAALWFVELKIVAATFGLQDIPVAAYYLTALATVWLVLAVGNWRSRVRLGYGLLASLSTLLLFVVVVNDYYQYFPTLGAMFNTSASHKQSEAASSVTSSHQHSAYALASIESKLYSGAQTKGTIEATTIPGVRSGLHARSSYIYLPPAYDEAIVRNVRFPVLILLTGTPGTPSSWLQGGTFENIMNSFASHHQGITPIVVITDHSGSFTNDTECLDSSHGNAETYLTDDVPSYIKQHYRVSSNPVNWGIGGFSEGGMCSAMLTLDHQDVFRHFLDLSGDPMPYLNDTSQTLPVLFHGSVTAEKQHNIDWLLQNRSLSPDVTGQFAIGADDNKHLISEMRQTYRLVSKRKLPDSFELIAHEGHSFKAWSDAYRDALPQLSYYLGATECETVCTP